MKDALPAVCMDLHAEQGELVTLAWNQALEAGLAERGGA